MPKLPKLNELTGSAPGILDKFRSMLDSLAGPGSAEITEEALAKETDPIKIKIMELELLVNQLNDIQVIQSRTVRALKTKHTELTKILGEKEQQKQQAEQSTQPEEPDKTSKLENFENPEKK